MRIIKNQKSKTKNQKPSGFTLIELLIVIALLGALAVGLLATVDPFEQLKKGTDTSRRNTTSEVYNAMIRYYSVKSAFPWGSAITGQSLNNANMSGWIGAVITAGELKPDFLQLAGSDNLGKIYVTSSADSGATAPNTVAVCFKPDSKSFRAEPNAKYNTDASPIDSGCLSHTSTGTACFWCIK